MNSNKVYSQFYNALVIGDKNTCRNIVQRLIKEKTSIRELYVDLFQRSLYEIGEMWEQNKVSVTTEHIATAIIDHLLSLAYPIIISHKVNNKPSQAKKILLSCVVNEYHQVGARIVSDIFELNKWDSYFSGANTPLTDLLHTIDQIKPECIGLSVSISKNLPHFSLTVQEIRISFPRTEILAGGQAFVYGGTDILKNFSNVMYIPSIEHLEKDFFFNRDA